MAKARYRPGDTIALKQGALGGSQPRGFGQILSVMPESLGTVRYRVRFDAESFERSVAQDDIDADASRPQAVVAASPAPSAHTKSSWINPNAVRTRK